jgi:hypothetical protein
MLDLKVAMVMAMEDYRLASLQPPVMIQKKKFK